MCLSHSLTLVFAHIFVALSSRICGAVNRIEIKTFSAHIHIVVLALFPPPFPNPSLTLALSPCLSRTESFLLFACLLVVKAKTQFVVVFSVFCASSIYKYKYKCLYCQNSLSMNKNNNTSELSRVNAKFFLWPNFYYSFVLFSVHTWKTKLCTPALIWSENKAKNNTNSKDPKLKVLWVRERAIKSGVIKIAIKTIAEIRAHAEERLQ